MLLAIDIGNTNSGFAVFSDDGEVVRSWRCATQSSRTADEYASWLMSLFGHAGLSFSDVHDVIIASVVPDANFNIDALCRRYFSKDALIINSAMVIDAGLEIDTDKPQEVGADRLVNAMAVREKYGTPSILIDFGTATNFDIISKTGAFSGGIIAPGISLSCDALYRASAKLPKIDIQCPNKVIGRNTIDAMRSGIYWGYVSLINGLVERCVEEIADGDDTVNVNIIATGGLVRVFEPDMPYIDHVDQDITTYGLYLLYSAMNKR